MKALKKEKAYEKLGAGFLGILCSEEGQGLVEFALILLLIVLVLIAMLKGVGTRVSTMYFTINSGLQNP